MKLLLEVLLAIFLHPVAWVLCVINIVGRANLSGTEKLVWILVTVVFFEIRFSPPTTLRSSRRISTGPRTGQISKR